jgi:hypothetical protein
LGQALCAYCLNCMDLTTRIPHWDCVHR